MKKIEPYPVASALLFIFSILFIVCVGVKYLLLSLGIEGIWHMHKIWELFLPGFNGLDSLSVLIGLLEVSVGAYLIGYIIIPLYNFILSKKLEKTVIEVKELKVRFKTLFFTFLVYVSILFTICLIYDLFVPAKYSMAYIWKYLLPGFNEISIKDYAIGMFDIVIYSLYTSFIFSKTFNYFEKSKLINVGKNN